MKMQLLKTIKKERRELIGSFLLHEAVNFIGSKTGKDNGVSKQTWCDEGRVGVSHKIVYFFYTHAVAHEEIYRT